MCASIATHMILVSWLFWVRIGVLEPAMQEALEAVRLECLHAIQYGQSWLCHLDTQLDACRIIARKTLM